HRTGTNSDFVSVSTSLLQSYIAIKLLYNYISPGGHTHPNTRSSALNRPPRLIEKRLPALHTTRPGGADRERGTLYE
ncbi:MAG: hypothetical protein KAR76_02985, partial [Methanosarcinales archaeon]|nr:hypothetical protein [Methanosarcinales archaeon]